MSTLQVHRVFCHPQIWIEEMINHSPTLLSKTDTMPKTAIMQHHVLIYWLSKGLSKIYAIHQHDEMVSDDEMTSFVERVISISPFHPSLLCVGVLYFDRFMKKQNNTMGIDNFKAHFIVCLTLACKMYEDLEKLNYRKIFKKDLSKFVEIEHYILNILEYNLVLQYDDFIELIQLFSQDIHEDVVDQVSTCWKRLFE